MTEQKAEKAHLAALIKKELDEHRLTIGVGACCGAWHQSMGGWGVGTKSPNLHLAEAIADALLAGQRRHEGRCASDCVACPPTGGDA